MTGPGPAGGDGTALVVGLGRTGRAAAAALTAAGWAVRGVDEADAPDGVAALRELGAEATGGSAPAGHLDGVDLVVLSPGVPPDAAVVAAARGAGVPVLSEPELAWRLHRPDVLGVTGTNGKTTVTELVAAMLRASGVPACPCGNIGDPLVTAAGREEPGAVLVAELSSFQLAFSHRLRVRVGALLNLADDHLDWHGDRDAYGRAKARLWRAQRPADWAVVGADEPATLQLAAEHRRGPTAAFSGRRRPDHPGVGVADGRLHAWLPDVTGPLLPVGRLASTAPHHLANVAAAATVSLLAGADPDAVAGAAASFTPGRHRLEVVGTHAGITWIDDSKATNPHAAAAALDAHPEAVWIAGGLAKGVDLAPLGDHLDRVPHAVLIGDAAGALEAVCRRHGVPTTRAGSMADAVGAAAAAAPAGGTVLLAPACASFDMFDDYADRGEQFAAAAAELEAVG